MHRTSNPRGTQFPVNTTADNTRRVGVRLRPLPVALFLIGVIVLTLSAFMVHAHPQPYPIEMQTTNAVQSMKLAPVVVNVIDFVSSVNDPTPSIIALGVWLVGLIIIGLIARLRGKSPVKWIESALGIIATVGIGSGINYLYNILVHRPRPGSFHERIRILVQRPEKSFPSGHTEHDVVYYGFLLFLSFTPPVRTWKYRWLLIPFQIYFVFDILTIGFSRILAGAHWLTDVLAGYLSGTLWLLMCIFLYRWITAWIALKLEARHQTSSAS